MLVYTLHTYTQRTHIFMLEVTNDVVDDDNDNDAYAKQAQPINC